MVTSYTPNLNLAKPLVNGPETENTWGFDLNANADKLDAFAASRGIEFVDDRVAQLLKAGPNVGLQYDDFGNTITISATGSMTVLDPGEGAVFFATRTHALPMSLDAAVKTFHTGGFSGEGDGGHGTYARIGAAPADPTNPGFVQLADDSWWRLVPQGGQVFIQQFGYKADWSGTTGTDNWPVLQYAKAFTAYYQAFGNVNWSYAILVPPGDAYFSQQIAFFECVQIKAYGGYMNVGSPPQVRWHFPNTITWMVFHQNNTGPGEDQGIGGIGSSTGSMLEGIALIGVGDENYENLNLRGILMRTMVHLRNVQVWACAGDAFSIRAYAGYGGALEGNANCWRMEYCLAHSPGGEFLKVDGGDANAGISINFVTHGHGGGCGIRNESWYVNTYLQPQITGYGNAGVSHGDKWYVLINRSAGVGEATTPGTNNNVWYYLQEGGVLLPTYPAWTPTPPVPYRLRNPIWDSGGGSVYLGVYVETGNAHPSHIPPPSLMVIGNAALTQDSNGLYGHSTLPGLQISTPFRVARVFPNTASPEYIQNGGGTYVTYGKSASEGKFAGEGGIQFFSHARDIDGESLYEFGYHGGTNDILYSLGTINFLRITPATTKSTLGSAGPRAHRLAIYDPILVDQGDSNNARTLAMRLTTPGGVGQHVRGDRYFSVGANGSGTAGWVCSQSGVIVDGNWSASVISGGVVVKTDENKCYRNKIFGTSVNKPTHVSPFTVTYPDNMTWTYLGTGETPLFQAVQDVPVALFEDMQATIQSLTERLDALEAR